MKTNMGPQAAGKHSIEQSTRDSTGLSGHLL